ncbi:MAG: hypothetical protein EZS28_046587 [Streblomastix strix]|uniref:Uncharacterized protein n=1 Tax=Streblomastix strix TaxID=222440 RepID=A0A5J4THC9_9EUKA|nr:MAG: hypothetical protein EZS28_046587 [Streblomastix strix]
MNSYGNFNLVGVADAVVSVVADAVFEQIIASMNLNFIPDMLCLTMIYLAIRATSNFEELNPITGTSQCYGIVSSSYFFDYKFESLVLQAYTPQIGQYFKPVRASTSLIQKT